MVEGMHIGAKEVHPTQEEDWTYQPWTDYFLGHRLSNVKECYLEIVIELLCRFTSDDFRTITAGLQYQASKDFVGSWFVVLLLSEDWDTGFTEYEELELDLFLFLLSTDTAFWTDRRTSSRTESKSSKSPWRKLSMFPEGTGVESTMLLSSWRIVSCSSIGILFCFWSSCRSWQLDCFTITSDLISGETCISDPLPNE